MRTRRQFLWMGGGFVALLPEIARTAGAAEIVDIEMGGRNKGAHVWFDPVGLLIKPGQTIRWTNRDDGNSHTATAYHPDLYDRARRIPQRAKPWDTGFLLPGETFSVRFTEPGVYDYYCIPHEGAGMVGRIIVGVPLEEEWLGSVPGTDLPEAALNAFPSIEQIMSEQFVRK